MGPRHSLGLSVPQDYETRLVEQARSKLITEFTQWYDDTYGGGGSPSGPPLTDQRKGPRAQGSPLGSRGQRTHAHPYTPPKHPMPELGETRTGRMYDMLQKCSLMIVGGHNIKNGLSNFAFSSLNTQHRLAKWGEKHAIFHSAV